MGCLAPPPSGWAEISKLASKATKSKFFLIKRA